MSNVSEKFKLSSDEFRNITRCLENEEFRKLFVEYCEELNDPENRKRYEDELKMLEAERGYDVKFIKPLPGYVIKTVSQGKIKAFINVCHCDLIEKPVSQCSTNEKGQKGLKWSIPYAQSHPRKDYDNKRNECVVYDVVFHYDTLYLTKTNAVFRKLVTDTAIDAVEKSFNVTLDRVNLKFPKLQYKGVAKMTVIRKKSSNFDGSQGDCLINKFSSMPKLETSPNGIDNKENISEKTIETKVEDYVTPTYKVIHRKDVEYQELTAELDAKMELTVPKVLVLVINLPLLKSAAECTLNVTTKELHLISEKPAKYKLEFKLPFEVLEKEGNAKFNTDEKTLTVSLPVLNRNRVTLNDINCANRVDSHTVNKSGTQDEATITKTRVIPPICQKGSQIVSMIGNRKIVFPKFSTNKMDHVFAFTLNVRNVDPASIELQKSIDTVCCRFTNIGSGFFPCYYVFVVRFPDRNVTEVLHEEWDNNLILHVELDSAQVDCYYAGADENNMEQYSIMEDIADKIDKFGKEIEDDSLCIAVSKAAVKRERKSSGLSIEIKTKSDTDTSDDDGGEVAEREHKTDQTLCGESYPIESKDSGENSTNPRGEEKEDETINRQAAENDFKKSKKNSRKKNKKRSLSESCCDQLKVVVENDISKPEQNTAETQSIVKTIENKESTSNVKPRKTRSVSESFSSNCTSVGGDSDSVDNLTALIHFNRKCKGILKRSCFDRSISECSSIDEPLYLATSVDCSSLGESVEHPHGELSESCRKTVRFNDSIKTQTFRSNSSILAQKKKNAKKNKSKRRSLTRRLSEGESTDYDDKEHLIDSDVPISGVRTEQEHDSGISLDSDTGHSSEKQIFVVIEPQLQGDSTKPIDISQAVVKNISNSKNENSIKKTKSSPDKATKRVDSSDIEFKADMIFDIEM
ncbi:protein kintoun [Topomyia yanbarensis]|uniref:protein kintoun n=1 Tax=Topomyia yanbarensis TaxID=2498891 RepID=UPI00273CE00C|nr:protein kintoun [Topomyia yanbarensis]